MINNTLSGLELRMGGTRSHRPKLSPVFIAIISGMASAVIWLAPSLFTPGLNLLILPLSVLQAILIGVGVWTWASSRERRDPLYGPGIMTALMAHIVTKYGIANVSPVLFPESTYMTSGAEPVWFIYATFAALMMTLGCILGVRLVDQMLRTRTERKSRNSVEALGWLPGPRVLITAAVVIQLLLLYATVYYGREWGSFSAESHLDSNLPLHDQLIVYGILDALPFAPVLAAAALLQTNGHKTHRRIFLISFAFLILTVGCLSIWRMRLWAMLSFAMAFLIWIRSGFFRKRKLKVVLPLGILGVYVLLTQVRYSDLPYLLTQKSLTEISFAEAVQAIKVTHPVPGSGDPATRVMKALLKDLSYGWAGLDAPAAIIKAQVAGKVTPQLGSVLLNGFLSALPSSLRPQGAVLMSSKAAGIQMGVLSPRDYIAPLLLEFVLDFGFILVIIPAFFFGVGTALVDHVLRMWSKKPSLSGLKIVRLIWLVQVVFVGSVAGVSLIFAKATVGLVIVLLFIGWFNNLRRKKYSGSVGLPKI